MQSNDFDGLDVTRLAFDSGRMAAGLRTWVETESPTYERDAVNRMMNLAAHDLALLGAVVQRIPGTRGFGDCVKASFPHSQAGRPGILVLGHLDTVHPLGTIEHFAWREQDGRCYGPGVLDMKAGNYLALEAIGQLTRIGHQTPLPVTVLFTSDEEVGSPSTRALIEAEAARHRYVLVPEPARRNGGVVTGRYAIARFDIETRGRPSHAGLRLGEGVSAIREMAHQIIAVEAMTDAEAGYSVGVVQGGRWSNCVSTTCRAKALVSATTDEKLAEAIGRMERLEPVGQDVQVLVSRDVVRPVWAASPASWALYEHAARLAQAIGLDIPHQDSGGGSDGNFTGAMAIATLDGLGARGDGPHTLEEHIVTESLAERARLVAALLATLDGSV